MKKRLILSIVLLLTVFFMIALAEGGEIKVMVAIGLLDVGEDAKLISVRDYQKNKSDYEDFQALVKKAITLREMVREGWSTVHVEPVGDSYYIFVFEK